MELECTVVKLETDSYSKWFSVGLSVNVQSDSPLNSGYVSLTYKQQPPYKLNQQLAITIKEKM